MKLLGADTKSLLDRIASITLFGSIKLDAIWGNAWHSRTMRTICGRPNTHAISISGPEVDQTVQRNSGIPLLKLLRSEPECFLYCITIISLLGSVPPVTVCCNASHGWGMRSSVCRCWDCYWTNSHAVGVARPEVDQTIMGDRRVPLLELLGGKSKRLFQLIAGIALFDGEPSVAIGWGS